MQNLLFSYAGRINRGKFWLGAVILTVINGVLFSILGAVASTQGEEGVSALYIVLGIICLLIMVASVYCSVCLGIKRYHDRDKSGVWVLIQFVPAIGAIWYFIEAGCLRGTAGPNQYGADPLDASNRFAAA